jgi:hypothetical protein
MRQQVPSRGAGARVLAIAKHDVLSHRKRLGGHPSRGD